jgi:hypothetical protein
MSEKFTPKVTMPLADYDNLKKSVSDQTVEIASLKADSVKLNKELEDERVLSRDLRKALLRESLSDFRICSNNYALEELTDPDGWSFAIPSDSVKTLLSLGIQTQEMVDAIKERRAEWEKSQKESK